MMEEFENFSIPVDKEESLLSIMFTQQGEVYLTCTYIDSGEIMKEKRETVKPTSDNNKFASFLRGTQEQIHG